MNKIGAGTIQRIILGDGGTLCTIYDNTAASGTIIAVLDTAVTFVQALEFQCPFYNGLTLVTTNASTEITVIYE